MHTDVSRICLDAARSIQEAVAVMDASRLGIVLVVDGDRRLLGTMTDGDVRRALLARMDLRQPVSALLASKASTRFATPLTARIGGDPAEHLELLRAKRLTHLPLLDEAGRVAGLVRLDDFVPEHAEPVQAVVMAGGQGSRLYPLTKDTPKPMLKVGDRPLLEIIIGQLREAGITQVTVSTHHQAEKITTHFGDGKEFGVQLSYLAEAQPLGTVGGLGRLQRPSDTTLVINGDVLTQVDFRAMLAFHREHQAVLTVAVRQYDVQVPFGVLECDGPVVRRLNEKPVFGFFVNAGIYVLEPAVYDFIPPAERLDMTELIQRLLDAGKRVVSFPVREYWLDIGEQDAYQQAQDDAKQLSATE